MLIFMIENAEMLNIDTPPNSFMKKIYLNTISKTSF